jgi:hypothetical protein
MGCRTARVRTAVLPRDTPSWGSTRNDGEAFGEDALGTAGVNPAYKQPVNFFHSYLCCDSFKDVGWDVEVGVNLLDVVVLLE